MSSNGASGTLQLTRTSAEHVDADQSADKYPYVVQSARLVIFTVHAFGHDVWLSVTGCHPSRLRTGDGAAVGLYDQRFVKLASRSGRRRGYGLAEEGRGSLPEFVRLEIQSGNVGVVEAVLGAQQ